jgi:hypothetical protein
LIDAGHSSGGSQTNLLIRRHVFELSGQALLSAVDVPAR